MRRWKKAQEKKLLVGFLNKNNYNGVTYFGYISFANG